MIISSKKFWCVCPYNSLNEEDSTDFLIKVIEQSNRILKDKGLLVFHADANLKISIYSILNDIFGKESFEEEFIIPIRNGAVLNTLILYYKDNRGNYDYYRPYNSMEIEKQFPLKDELGSYKNVTLFRPHSNHRFNFTWNGIEPPEGRSWIYSKERLDLLYENGLIKIDKSPVLKRYFDQLKNQIIISRVWNDLPKHTPFKENDYTVYSQPIEFADRILNIANLQTGLVIDPFMGSGSFVLATHQNKLNWIGNDSSIHSCSITQNRLIQKEKEGMIDITKDLSDYPIIYNKYKFISEIKQVIELIRKGESEFVEFKEASFWNRHRHKSDDEMIDSVIKAIVAFLNSYNGGVLFIGIEDKNNSITGLEKDYEIANKQKNNFDGYQLRLTEKIEHNLGLEASRNLNFQEFYIESKPICRITIQPSKEPVFYKDDFIFRKKAGKETIKKAQLFYQYLLKRWGNNDSK